MKRTMLLLIMVFTGLTVFEAKAQTQPYMILTSTTDTTDAWYEPVRILRDY